MKTITECRQWTEALEAFPDRDFYFTWDYHRLEADRNNGTPVLFVFERQDFHAALPLIVRDIPGARLKDATSVYGYAGPLAAGTSDAPTEFATQLREVLDEMQVVSVFSRLHPVLDSAELLAGLGEVADAGQTISIDLTESDDEQWRQHRGNLKRDIKSLRASNVEVAEALDQKDVESFVEIYNDTMRRRGAVESYLISTELIQTLRASDQFDARLFKCELDGRMICGGLFIACGGMLQYHWSGTDAEHYRLAPTKLLLDHVRRWATDAGLRVFHLGGGVGGEADSLFRFKKGFSRNAHEFRLWRWVVREDDYADLCRRRDADYSGPELSNGFFPFYRKPD